MRNGLKGVNSQLDPLLKGLRDAMRSLFKFSCSGGPFVSITAPVKGVYPFGAIGRRNAAKTTSFAPD